MTTKPSHDNTPAANVDQQDCPAMASNGLDDTLVDCGWSGEVMRYALDGVTTDNGYTWTCPKCGTVSDWLPDEPPC